MALQAQRSGGLRQLAELAAAHKGCHPTVCWVVPERACTMHNDFGRRSLIVSMAVTTSAADMLPAAAGAGRLWLVHQRCERISTGAHKSFNMAVKPLADAGRSVTQPVPGVVSEHFKASQIDCIRNGATPQQLAAASPNQRSCWL